MTIHKLLKLKKLYGGDIQCKSVPKRQIFRMCRAHRDNTESHTIARLETLFSRASVERSKERTQEM